MTDIDPIDADMPDNEVANLFERNDWVSAPVVDKDGKLLGRSMIVKDNLLMGIREKEDFVSRKYQDESG